MLPAAIAQQVNNTVLSMLSHNPDATGRDITRKIQLLYMSRGVEGYNYAEYRSAVDAAIQSAYAAGQYGPQGQSAPERADLPRVQGIGPNQPDVVARVVIYIDNPGGASSVAVDVRSDQPMTYQALFNEALEMVMNSQSGRDYISRAGGATDATRYHMEVISIGQRR